MLSSSDRSFLYTYLAHTIENGLHPKESLAAYISDISLPAKRKEELKSALFLFTKKSSLGEALQEARVICADEARLLLFAKQNSLPEKTILAALGEHLRKRSLVSKKIRTLLVYPAILLGELALVVSVVLIYLMPQMNLLFAQLNSPEPGLVRLLASAGKTIGEFLTIKNLPFVIAVLALLLWVFSLTRRFFSRAVFSLALRLPLTGQLLRLVASEKIFGMLAVITETNAKPNMSDAFKAVAECEKNLLYKKTLAELSRAVKEQTPLARVLNQQKNRFSLPVIVRRMLILGEKRGNVPYAIHALARILPEELDIETRRFTSLLEPLLVISIALAVGGIGLMVQRVFASLQNGAVGW